MSRPQTIGQIVAANGTVPFDPTTYYVCVAGTEFAFRTASARFDAYVRFFRQGARDLDAYDVTPRYGRLDVSPVTIIF